MAFTVKDRYVFSGLSFECFQRTAVPPALNVHEVGVQTDEPALPQFAPPSNESSLPHVAPMTTDTDRLFAAERNREYDAELSRQQFRSQKLVEVLHSEYSDDGATANLTELLHVDEYAAPAPEPSLSRVPVSGTLAGLHVNE